MKCLLAAAGLWVTVLFASASSAAIVASFDLEELAHSPGSITVIADVDNSTSIGSATLDSTGTLIIDIIRNIDADYSSTLGEVFFGSLSTTYTFNGLLTGNNFAVLSGSSIQTSCTVISDSLCSNSVDILDWIVLTDPIFFDFSVGGLTDFDAMFDYAGLTLEEVGYRTFSLETMAIPIPAGVWLFLSALGGLSGICYKQNHSLEI